MISIVKEDFFKTSADYHLHQANCLCIMGGGIAKKIAFIFPEAKKVDSFTGAGIKSKLGKFSLANVNHSYYQNIKTIVNLYCQFDIGDGKQTDYEALYNAFLNFKNFVLEGSVLEEISEPKFILAVPYGIGCGLAGGDWHIVKAILESLFSNDNRFHLKICLHPEFLDNGVTDSKAKRI